MLTRLIVPTAAHVLETCQLVPTAAHALVLLHLQEVFLTPHHLGIAMEYVDGGDLAQWVQMHRIPDVRAGCDVVPNAT